MFKKKRLKIVDQFSKSGKACKKSSIKKNIDQKKTKIAICITCGEQSEIHAGMVKHGDGLAKNGYSIEKMRKIEENFTIHSHRHRHKPTVHLGNSMSTRTLFRSTS